MRPAHDLARTQQPREQEVVLPANGVRPGVEGGVSADPPPVQQRIAHAVEPVEGAGLLRPKPREKPLQIRRVRVPLHGQNRLHRAEHDCRIELRLCRQHPGKPLRVGGLIIINTGDELPARGKPACVTGVCDAGAGLVHVPHREGGFFREGPCRLPGGGLRGVVDHHQLKPRGVDARLLEQAPRGPQQALWPAEGGDHQRDIRRACREVRAHGDGATVTSSPTASGPASAPAAFSASA